MAAPPADPGPGGGPTALARVVVEPGGPVLVEGPVEVLLPDGTRVCSDRPVVAICACRRSKHYPFCDTSHRERARPGDPPSGSDARRED